MVQWLGTLSENLGSVPSTHLGQFTIAYNSSSRGIRHLWLLRAPMLTGTLSLLPYIMKIILKIFLNTFPPVSWKCFHLYILIFLISFL